jgi:hypothetical protein
MNSVALNSAVSAIGLSVVLMTLGSVVLAADTNRDQLKTNGTADAASAGSQTASATKTAAVAKEDDIKSDEFNNNNMERPMRVTDESRPDQSMTGRDPGCGLGLWRNAINHMHCGSGYDSY